MEIKLYPTPGGFLADNRAFLQENEAVCQLTIVNALSHREEPCRPDLLFGRYEEAGSPILLFCHTAPWNLCLNSRTGDARAEAAAGSLARYLQKEAVDFGGINASSRLCQAFFAAYPKPFRMRSAMDVMVLKAVIDPPIAPGRLRKAAPEDLDLLARWYRAFSREATHEELDPAAAREMVRSFFEKGSLYLWEDGAGAPVATVCTPRVMGRGVSLGGVYTLPERRGQGFCQNMTAALCRRLLSSGLEYCTLFVDQKNPISNRAYAKVGFKVVEDNYDYRLKSP